MTDHDIDMIFGSGVAVGLIMAFVVWWFLRWMGVA